MAVTGKKPSEWSAATIEAVQTATGINAKIANVVEDTTPQLGGDLDTQGNVIIGGTAVGSTLSLKSTTADGTLTAKALSVLTGNNGATEAVTVLNNGNVGIGNIAPALVLQGSSTKDIPFTIGAGTPAQEASSVAGNNLTLTASNAVAGSANAGTAKGGNVNITAGNAERLTSGNDNGGNINITSGNAIGYGKSGAVNILSSSVGDISGIITIKTGAGSASGNLYLETGIPTGASSGSIYIRTAKAAGSEGVPGQLYLISGDGTNKYETGGNGGNINITPGSGGGLTGGTNRKGGNGANINLTSGAGADATGGTTNTGGNSGNITLDIGASGTGATANGTVGYVLLAPTRGNVGVGLTVPTAVLHIKAGTASASSAPLKLTSGTLMTVAEAGAVEFLTDAFYGTITTGAVRKQFAFVESSPHLVNKAASANVRNSHDAEATSTESDYTKVKTITLSKGLLGQQRFLFDIKTSNAGVDLAYGKIYRNGVALGTEQSDTTGSYVTKSEDITQTWLPGDTCELWIKIANASTASVQNFRIAYDDSPTVTVTSVNS